MKAFFRKLARVKKRKAIKRAIAGGFAAWALKYGRINQTTYTGAVSEIQNQHNKPPEAAKLILNLKKFIKRTKRVSVAYLIEKGKQVCILIFSKEVLVAVFILLNSGITLFSIASLAAIKIESFLVSDKDARAKDFN